MITLRIPKKQMFLIDNGTYPGDMLVCIGCEHAEIVAFVEKHKKYTLDEVEKDAIWLYGIGRTVRLKSGNVIMRIDRDGKFYSILAHETFHAVELLFEHIGIKHCDSSSEAFAYQIGYIYERILEKIK